MKPRLVTPRRLNRCHRLLIAAVIVAAARVVDAQSIDPPIAIFEAKASGSVTIANGSLYPVSFVLEPRSFAVSCGGDVGFMPLDTTRIRLKLSTMSGRIPARQSVKVFYEATTDSLPAWFAIIASFGRSQPSAGLSMRVELPHVVYLMQKDRVVERDIRVGEATYSDSARLLRVEVENRSAKLTRILDVTVTSTNGQSHAIDACPLFPGSSRQFEHTWRELGRPVSVTIRFPGFSVTRAVVP
jgi:hypothetical protein